MSGTPLDLRLTLKLNCQPTTFSTLSLPHQPVQAMMTTQMQSDHVFDDNAQILKLQLVKGHKTIRAKKRLKCIHYGLIVAVLIIIVSFMLTIHHGISNNESSSSLASDDDSSSLTFNAYEVNISYCKTGTCYNLASDVQRTMNASVDPCVNFYDYVRGGWIH